MSGSPDPRFRRSALPLSAGIAAAALFGAATPASKALLKPLSPFQLAGLLYLGAALAILPLLISKRSFKPPWRLPRRTFLQLTGAVFFGGLLGPVLLLLGLRLASAASVALWLNLELVGTVLLGHLFFRDRLTPVSALAAGGTLLAAILLTVSEGSAGWQAGLLVFLACLAWGLDNHFTALIDGITPSQTTFWKGLVAGGVNLGIGASLTPILANPWQLGQALLVGAFAYGFSIVLYIASAQQLGAARSQIIFSSSPFFGVALSALFLSEAISGAQWAAMLLIGAALVFLGREQHVHEHEHQATEHEHWHRHDDGHHGHEHAAGDVTNWHSHGHRHRPMKHWHAHWPDLHHRHEHSQGREA